MKHSVIHPFIHSTNITEGAAKVTGSGNKMVIHVENVTALIIKLTGEGDVKRPLQYPVVSGSLWMSELESCNRGSAEDILGGCGILAAVFEKRRAGVF